MIRNSFIFLEKIGEKLEKNIWSSGVKTWEDFLNRRYIKGISRYKKFYYNRKIIKAKKNLYYNNSCYFYDLLPTAETWRLYDYFKDDAVFLDIETTGLSNHSYLTLIGLYDGINTRTMIKGINLDFKALKEELRKYKLIVTFNGATFDIPFLNKRFPNLLPKIPNFDLRHACAKIGLTGGLKEIEKQLGIKRKNEIIEGMCGGDAVLLWRKFIATGDEHYLKLLVEYNEEDIINLKQIAEHVYKGLKNDYSPSNSINLKIG